MLKIIDCIKEYHRHVACLWFCCILILGVYCVNELFLTPNKLEHNLLSLLPNNKHMENISQSMSGKMVILLKHNKNGNQDATIEALHQIRELIKENRLPIVEQNYESLASEYKSLFKSMYPYRSGLLSENDRKLLIENKSREIVDQAISEALTPFATLGPINLQQDPFYLFPRFATALSKDKFIQEDESGNLFVSNEGGTWTLFQGNLKESAFSFQTQEIISKHIMPLLKKFEQNGTNVLTVGAIFHAIAGGEQAKNEVSHIGILSILCIVGLLLFVFRTLALFRIVTVIILSAIVVGIATCLLVFHKIHVLSLVFGCSLVGVCVDYAIHYYCKTYQYAGNDIDKNAGRFRDDFKILKTLTPALPLAALSSCVGYLVLVFIPFPGVQQMAILASVGLLTAFLSIYLWGPYLVKIKDKKLPPMSQKINTLLQDLVNFGSRFNVRKILMVVMLMVSAAGIIKLHFEDRLQYFQPMNERLKNDELIFKSLVSYDNSFQHIQVKAESLEAVLQRIEDIVPELERLKLKNSISGYRSIASLIPSQKRQQENRALVTTLYHENLKVLSDKLNIKNINDLSVPGPFGLNEQFLRVLPNLPEGWSDLIQVNDTLVTAKIFLADVRKNQEIMDLIKRYPNVDYVNPVNEYTELFALYRNIITAAIIIVFSIIALFILFYKNAKAMIEILSPIFLSMIFTFGLLSCLGFPLTLFHMLGLMLVQCLGIDYAFFLYWKNNEENLLANALTAMTTIMSFGFLTFSSSPAVHDFGLSVFIGILTCFFITTFYMGKPRKT